MSAPRPDVPVLVGCGVATCREADFERAPEPIDLMIEAATAAGRATGVPAALAGVQVVAVPRGRWRYADPGRAIARAVGAPGATSVLATLGALQQTLIGDACARIARGEAHTTLVAGGDAGHRILRAQLAGRRAGERECPGEPDQVLRPAEDLLHPAEVRAGLKMPVALYAIIESAFRARAGLALEAHRDRLADLWARFARVAEGNPHAWNRRPPAAREIRDAGERNPMLAFPYTRHHCASWNVDQAGALLFCSEARAAALGIDRARWVYPLASTESNHMSAVTARADLAACPGARIAGRAALDEAGLALAEVDLVELYSCFPVAVETCAAELGLSLEGDLTVTGGMAFAGGPFNNTVLQSTARVAELLLAGAGRHALVSSVSGILTKQGFGLWSREAPRRPFVQRDVSDAVARECPVREVVTEASGPARIAGCTVLRERDKPARAIAVVDLPAGARAIVTCEDAAIAARVEGEECVGRDIRVEGGAWVQ